MSGLLIQKGDVLQLQPQDRRVDILRQQDILVRGNTIEAVQPTGRADASHFDTVIDASGMLVTPGLVNTHAHVPMVIFRGLAEDVSLDRWFNDYMWPLERNLQPEDVYWGMKLGLAEMIKGGITTVADHYFFLDRGAQAIEEAGTRALLGWAMFGTGGEAALKQSIDFIREYDGAANGRIRTILAPHAPYTCDDDFLRATARAAEKLGVGVHIHAAETMSQTRASLDKRGLTPIQVLEKTGLLDFPTIVAHGCGLIPDDIEILADARAGIAHAPKTYLKLAMGITPIVELQRAGVLVGLATDGAVSNNTMDLWEALRLMAMMQKDRAESAEVMTIPEALDIAFRQSGELVQMATPQSADKLGMIAPGYLADLVLIDMQGIHHQPLHSVSTSLVYNMMASDVQTVIIDGQIVMRDRQLLTLDEAEIVAQVKQGMARLAQRHPDQRIQVYNP